MWMNDSFSTAHSCRAASARQPKQPLFFDDGAGLTDVIHDPACTVFYKDVPYDNLAAFAAAHSPWEVALLDEYLFVVADEVGTWTVDGVIIGKPGK